jgi:hypothetical protein
MAEEEWGWIPYHYGRWGWEPRLGWFWVPATVWAPAWVTWRWSGLYIGWAPLPPGIEFVIGVGVRSPYDIPSHYWVFLEGRYFQHDYLDRYVLPYERNSTIVRLTVHKSDLTLRNRQIINEGIDVDEVRRLTRTDVSRYELGDARSPRDSRVSGETAFIYRPAVKKNDSAKPKSYIQKDEAEKRIPEIRARDLEGRGTSADQERRLKEDQDREMRLLKQSQEKEDADLRQKVEDEKRLASGAAEKEKAAKEGEVKAGELKKAHDEEKTKVAERHREEEKVVKGRLKKKGED